MAIPRKTRSTLPPLDEPHRKFPISKNASLKTCFKHLPKKSKHLFVTALFNIVLLTDQCLKRDDAHGKTKRIQRNYVSEIEFFSCRLVSFKWSISLRDICKKKNKWMWRVLNLGQKNWDWFSCLTGFLLQIKTKTNILLMSIIAGEKFDL